MEMNEIIRNLLEIGFGLIYLIGAIFNSLYTLKHGDEFYGSFARGAWFPPSRRFVQTVVIPRSRVFTFLLIVFQVLVAFAVLSRGTFVVYGLIAGTVFCLGVVFVANPAGAIANLLMAALQFFLAYTR
jgi:hypothetical protein